MKWVLIWVIITGQNITSGSADFATKELCEQAALGTRVELLVAHAVVKARCYPICGGCLAPEFDSE